MLGMVWIGLGIFNVMEDDNLRWSDYGYLCYRNFIYRTLFIRFDKSISDN